MKKIVKNNVTYTPRTIVEQRDEIILNGEKLERGKDYNINKDGKLILSRETMKKIENSSSFVFQSFYSQKITRKCNG